MADILKIYNPQTSQWVAIPSIVGPQGPAGSQGPQGQTGPAGQGVSSGGTTGQILQKKSNTDYDTEWVDKPSVEDATQEEVRDIFFTPHVTLTSSEGVFTLGGVVAVNEYAIVEGVQG